MKNLQSYKSQIEEVKGLIQKLDQGKLTIEELTELESLTRSLHEKSIILKYKAFENSVKQEDVSEVEEEIVEESTEVEEEAGIDSPFAWEPESSIQVEVVVTETTIEIEEEIIIEESSEMDEADDVAPPSIGDIMDEFIEPVEKIVEHAIEEAVADAIEREEVSVAVENDSGTFLDHLNISDQSLHSKMNISKIETLIGAFSLNEKLRYINDLFDGSSELFSDAIKVLDSQSTIDEANLRVNDLADQHSWDPEEESVVEFISFVNRRYA